MDIVGFLLPYPKQLVNGALDESLAEREDGEFLAQVVAIDNAEFFDGMGGRAVLPPRANIAVGIPCAVLEYVLTGVDNYKEGDMDQVDRVLYDLKHNPASRRILTNIYVHQDLSEMALYPCAYSMTFNVTGKKLNAILNQRSQDMLAANIWNVCQYSALVCMFAQVSGLEPGEFVHVIADAHIYDRHVPIVKELIEREPYDAPEFIMDKSIDDFYKFTKDSFSLKNYRYHEFTTKIPVAV